MEKPDLKLFTSYSDYILTYQKDVIVELYCAVCLVVITLIGGGVTELQGLLGETGVFRWFSVSVEFAVDIHSAVAILQCTGELLALSSHVLSVESVVFCTGISNN